MQLIIFLRQPFVRARLSLPAGPGCAALGRGSRAARCPRRERWQRLRRTGRSRFSALRPKPAATAAAPGRGGQPALRTPLAGWGRDEGPALGPCSPRGVPAGPPHTGQGTRGTAGARLTRCSRGSRNLPSASASGKAEARAG